MLLQVGMCGYVRRRTYTATEDPTGARQIDLDNWMTATQRAGASTFVEFIVELLLNAANAAVVADLNLLTPASIAALEETLFNRFSIEPSQ